MQLAIGPDTAGSLLGVIVLVLDDDRLRMRKTRVAAGADVHDEDGGNKMPPTLTRSHPLVGVAP